VIDAGINVEGSFEAGRLFSQICMSGLGRIDFCELTYDDFSIPGVKVTVSNPVLACMGSQYAGWTIKVERRDKKPFQAMGSGPARSVYFKEELLKKLDIKESADRTVLLLETGNLPDDEVAIWVSKRCSIPPERIFIIAAPTASLAGSIQIAARIVETGLHKMVETGFNIKTITAAIGVCPVAPVAENDLKAMGRTNDAVLFGGKAWYTAGSGPEAIEKIINLLPSSASKDYGTPFYDLFKGYGYDFYKIDPMLFSPAEVSINDTVSGKTYRAGRVNPELLKRGLFS
ncbi:MAG: methenyltetrahydromethanopterin cyclohydrolase, partial [Deltaproteobacteria bacterium]|nr:methenyltetrahydromethanopterin cyclohydrolase [Deltaproteobacteria bacterium]